jgi:hypothetical protein
MVLEHPAEPLLTKEESHAGRPSTPFAAQENGGVEHAAFSHEAGPSKADSQPAELTPQQVCKTPWCMR